MSNQRATFAKRQREQELKDKARAKEARRVDRASRANDPNNPGGPQIAWDEAVRAVETVDVQQGSLVPNDDTADNSSSGS
jgi:hypothetical protein